ncbi:TetR/AcrR family transcriptional regulator [Oceanobacillus neutriphilus]|uniref:AcrR family transcriptional regulator n=1 Tax=Oceanobacillus neutriphilus TaxID=531815 RepID=A0ABQ2NUQ1_9BACI|nr:TetR/AcrR family transcriptional regulator [Oceanobacillus neutriphilus]GGP10996.1 AcrR family transcriptional regulator [Oceanobacillus neutriphilus]
MGKNEDIIAGLFSVMETYDFSLITVTQIAQEAGVGRKTFYRYFKNKEEVLEKSVELLFLEYSSSQDNYFASNYEELIYNHFLFWVNHLPHLKVIYKNGLMLYLFKQYQKYVPKLNDYYLSNIEINHSTAIYANAFTTGIFWSMLYTWLENGAKETPEELAAICMDFLQNKV